MLRRNSTSPYGHERVVELDDSVLWSRVQAGDADAFGQVFERHAVAVYNYCFRRLGDWHSAEDSMSIVFLEAWRRREKSLPPDKTLPWLLGIATNVVRNRRRTERRYAAAIGRVPAPRPEPSFSEDVEQRLDDERRMCAALKLFRQLPRCEQDVFALCVWSELSYQDAARALGLPVGTVRSRLSRARARLRELGATNGHNQDEHLITREALER